MRRTLPFLLLAAATLAPTTAGPALARERTAPAALSDRLAGRIAASGVRAGRLGVAVVSLDTGAVVFARDPDVPLAPASVAKVATTAAALDLLGPGHVFETRLDARGAFDPASGLLQGDLILRGVGDPGLSHRGHESDPLWPLSTFAQAAAAAGVRRVSGAVVLDDGGFDREFTHPTWTRSDLDAWYGAPLAGLVFNDSCVTVVARGGAEDGAPATVLTPSTSGPWPVVNALRTWDERRSEVGGAWVEDRRRLRVAGGVPPRQEFTFETPVPDPLAFVGAAQVAALKAAGISVEGGWRAAASAQDRAPGVRVESVRHGLPETLRVMNRRSQNLYASLLFKACAVEAYGSGTWALGERAVLEALARRGVRVAGLHLVDGSGLSAENRLTAGALARLLVSFDADPLRGPVLRDSLAVPGEEGTLEKRFRDADARARVRAKTGTLARTGVHSLVGYVDGRGGSRGYAFAILLADGRVGGAKDLIDDLVREILEG